MAKRTCAVSWCEKPSRARGWCHGHYTCWQRTGSPTGSTRPTAEQRWWESVARRADDECWPWMGLIAPGGYGRFTFTVAGKTRTMAAHRWGYKLLVGPVSDGIDLDHTCHNADECRLGTACPHRRCCNPAHLEPVTKRENNRRSNSPSKRNIEKTHCPQGHPYSGDNLYRGPDGKIRSCRTCAQAKQALYRARKRVEAGLPPQAPERVLKPCGTLTAYKRHRANGEEACEACLLASRLASRQQARERRARRQAVHGS